MYVLNAGFIFHGAMKLAKYILPKKLYQRIHLITLQELKDLIPDKYLLTKYGGKLEMEEDLLKVNYT